MNKKIFVLAVAILLSFAFIIGCKKESSMSNTSYSSNTSNSTEPNILLKTEDTYGEILDSMGIIHNQALEYAFIKIRNENLFIGLTDSAEIISLISDLTAEYLNERFAYIPYTYSSGFKDSILNAVFNNPNPSSSFSTIFNQKMAELMNVYNTADNPNEYKSFAISFLEDNINLIPENEQSTFKAAILVSYNSWEYWNANMITWINEYDHQNGLPPVARRFDVRECGKADIEGVIGGAIGGLAGGLAGVCLGAAFGGPIGSGVNAILQCFW